MTTMPPRALVYVLALHLVVAALLVLWESGTVAALALENSPLLVIFACCISTIGIWITAGPLFVHAWRPASPRTVIHEALYIWSISVPIIHLTCILFGAPIIDQFVRTLSFAGFCATVGVLPCGVILGVHPEKWRAILAFRFLQLDTWTSDLDHISALMLCGVAIGGWAGALVIPLDWDMPWQVWPIPCIYGATLGYLVAILTSCALVFTSKTKQQ